MTYRRLMGILVVVATCLTVGKVTFAQEPTRAKPLGKDVGPKDVYVNRPPVALVSLPADPPKGTVIAGMFEGTFSVGRTRVVAGKNATALVLASIAPDGHAHWMSSFDGLARGRAVGSIQAPGVGTVVVGVFKGKFNLELPKQAGFESGDGDGLFVAIVTPTGRVTVARMLGVAGGFSAPTVQLQSGKLVVEVPYQGAVSRVPLKSFPRLKPGPAILRLGLSRDGQVLSAESVKTPTGADTKSLPPAGGQLQPVPGVSGPTMGKAKVTPQAPGHLPSPVPPAGPTPMIALSAGPVCNVCIPSDVPPTDAACQSCRESVCRDDSDLWCCTTGWDRQCMNEAMDGTCPSTQRTCNCPHRTGDVGVWMYHLCTTPPPAGCVNNVCSGDGYCTFIEWDAQCVAESTCGGQ